MFCIANIISVTKCLMHTLVTAVFRCGMLVCKQNCCKKTEILTCFESKIRTVAALLAKVSTLSPKVTVITLEFWCNKKFPNAALNPIVARLWYVHSLNPFAYFWLWKTEKIFWMDFWSKTFFRRQILGSFYRYSNTYDIYLILYFLNAFM